MSEAIIDDAYQFLRAHLAGKIRFDGERIDIKIAPAPDGHLVASVMVSMLRSVDVVLELPDDSDDGLTVQVTLEAIEESGPYGALCDRWCIYNGEPPDVRWARMQIDAARFKGYFIDGQALTRANPFAEWEGAICKELNAACQPQVIAAALHTGKHQLVDPKVVGVDPWGIDVRAQIGIARIPASTPISSHESVKGWLATLASK